MHAVTARAFGDGSDPDKVFTFAGAVAGGGLAGRGGAWLDKNYQIQSTGLGMNGGNLRITPRTAPIQQNEVTTYQDFNDRSVVGDNLEGHELWQHANLKANDLATNRLSTDASKNNPVIALDRDTHVQVNQAQRSIDAANQTPMENIEANTQILRDNPNVPNDQVDVLHDQAVQHANNLGH